MESLLHHRSCTCKKQLGAKVGLDYLFCFQCGVLLVLTILFVPETAYVRPSTDVPPTESVVHPSDRKTDSGSVSPADKASIEQHDHVFESANEKEAAMTNEKAKTTFQLMKLWNNERYTDESFFKIAARPFTLLLSPVVMWGCLVYGTTNGWRTFL